MKSLLYLVVISLGFFSCSKPNTEDIRQVQIEEMKDPSVISYGRYTAIPLRLTNAEEIWNPMQIARSASGKLFVANVNGQIFSLEDTDGDGWEDYAKLYCSIGENGLRSPAGMTFRGDDLFVGTAQEIRVYLDEDNDGIADSSYTFFNRIPQSEHPYEWTSALAFGPDGHLYTVLTTDSWNSGATDDLEGLRGAYLKISPDGSSYERIATGVRSVPAALFTNSGELLFLDNEGGGNPNEELNLLKPDKFYGHNPEKYGNPSETEGPLFVLTADVAPSGLAMNDSSNNFDESGGDIFVSYYGPGERWQRGSISKIHLTVDDQGKLMVDETIVITDLPKISDIEFGNNGDLYATLIGRTDYWYQSLAHQDGAIYRIKYTPWTTPTVYEAPSDTPLELASVERGEQLFTDRACSAYHAIDGKTELLGPNLKYISQSYSREELIQEIANPGATVKPSMAPSRIVKVNGEVIMGRNVTSDQESIQVMVTGNKIIRIPKEEIASQETVVESLMYPGLIDDLSSEDKNALLDYLESLAQS